MPRRMRSPPGYGIKSSSFQAAASQVAVDASQFEVNAGSADFSGVVRCDTLVANSVVASSYTPGQGNVL